MPHLDAQPGSLLLPPARIGQFWTGGNPAGLRAELEDTRTDFASGISRESGSYKRPLDPGARTAQYASGSGWSALDARVAVIGRATLEQEHLDPGTFADVLDPYASSPLVTLDTTSTPTRRTTASLEGATGLQFGPWGVGLALGYESSERRTIEAGLVRLLRAATPGAVVGVTRGLGSVAVGMVGRWRHRAESIRLFERAAEGEVVELEGLREVTPIAIDAHYFRRTEETTWSLGLTAAGHIGTGHWAASLARDRLRQGLTRQEVDHPAQDFWRASGWSGSVAYQRPVGSTWRFTAVAGYASLRGTADLALDTVGVIFEATEQALTWHAELRRNLGDGGWGAVFATDVRYEHRVRDAPHHPDHSDGDRPDHRVQRGNVPRHLAALYRAGIGRRRKLLSQ